MFFGRSKNAQPPGQQADLQAKYKALKQKADVLDNACGVGLWEAILYEADALHPQSVWTWSPEFRRLCGYETQAEFPDVVQSWSDRLHPDDVEPTFAAFAASLKNTTGRSSYCVEYRLKIRDGSYRWFRAAGGCGLTPEGRVQACGSLVDIHEQKCVEERLATEKKESDKIISAMAQGLLQLAQGDLMARITTDVSPANQSLKDNFNSAASQLEAALARIWQNASTIRATSDEIKDASESLSLRTEQQAAALAQTAATLTHITEAGEKTAHGAQEAQSVVGSAKQDGERSNAVVQKAVEAMSAIQKSSSEIGQIIGVIDEIAFQTNLLALNAGVEAARAGEAGRGFAVVASEVRALAQRSAEAAKEIKSLILASNQQVNLGVEMVGEAGAALSRIVTQVMRINDVIGGIADSARDQAKGLSEINKAMNELDGSTHQNAAMAEESNAASALLASQSAELAHSIGEFKLETGEASSAQSSRHSTRANPARRNRAA